ncbi:MULTISPECIES: L,D-transpeptidase [Streptomycetaceae]|uniref:L,D-TPase catalytic domain-containing protein n=1 Tax=Streptantibioticus cattleyicolor (strain ATCC 35852 / DSM 46488 / JCM 4925 / NBRC 14057 / NRRL 8057) TaxID=1003195 RepID=F8JZB5_STREN|nr:L,D-transpeptidase [Streptantibioticus cattleyicolor]AEW95997.1 hypothetical protein SCATT_36260 [Streptantibioticus cattleyicolor NRRL 8057 = DSM 46488]MYS60529.1 L,D-transpeptidase family protein [Streptomyces sp. SID5468]CCB76328.1 conserved exported protein of unknown function [Streptantibioticus cattleyicolor NRRL 8057 = DSM 46488]
MGLLAAVAVLPLALSGTAAGHGPGHPPGHGAGRAEVSGAAAGHGHGHGRPKDRRRTVPPVPAGRGTAGVPLGQLVPGIPLPPGVGDTPDQVYSPPRVLRGHPAPPDRHGPEPTAAQLAAAERVEYVPADDAAAVHRGVRPYCSPHTGPYQREVERFLGLTPSRGRQTPVTCEAIRRYQQDHRIRPAIGFAGPVTWGIMQDEEAEERGADETQRELLAHSRCPAGPYRIACVDQNRQVMWVQRNHRVVFGPVRVRTGRPSTRTRNGLHRVYLRHRHWTSTIYHTPMPYAQFFDGGIAFHGVYESIYAPPGSYGCVNMRLKDAKRLWRVLHMRDRVYVWGHKPA